MSKSSMLPVLLCFVAGCTRASFPLATNEPAYPSWDLPKGFAPTPAHQVAIRVAVMRYYWEGNKEFGPDSSVMLLEDGPYSEAVRKDLRWHGMCVESGSRAVVYPIGGVFDQSGYAATMIGIGEVAVQGNNAWVVANSSSTSSGCTRSFKLEWRKGRWEIVETQILVIACG